MREEVGEVDVGSDETLPRNVAIKIEQLSKSGELYELRQRGTQAR